jgi:hypothetical protein
MEVLSGLKNKTLISTSHHQQWIQFTQQQVNLA